MYFFKGQGTGRKKNKQKLTDKLSQSTNESNEKGSAPQAKKQKKVLKDKTGQVVQDNEGLFQVWLAPKNEIFFLFFAFFFSNFRPKIDFLHFCQIFDDFLKFCSVVFNTIHFETWQKLAKR